MLVWLRYLLLILPALGTAYFIPLPELGWLTFCVLLLLVWAQARRSWLPEHMRGMASLIETLAIVWLGRTYGGLLFLCHLSGMVASSRDGHEPLRLPQLAFHLVALNATLYGHTDLQLTLVANLCALTIGGLLLRLSDAGRQTRDLEQVYDQLRHKAYELDAARNRLLEYAGRVEQLAQAEERTRIARDIHDDLGHKLIRSKMMLEAAIRLMPDRQAEALKLTGQVRDHLTESMDTLRHTVRRLKPADEELHSFSIRRLIDSLAADRGLAVSHHISGLPRPIYPSLEIILYRNAQEAVTNAIRHGGATEIDLHLHYDNERVVMTVSNNGKLPDLANLRKGLGLSGMEERVRLVGGELTFGGEHPFRIITILPLSQEGSLH
ncbi:sensor histidine kinase [Paenibacillus filicis]|uniref:histidine kinase n=1 Tax=Paenibacillus filicis TaxID=669464 RepID=A0ABU9DQ15_9BACL